MSRLPGYNDIFGYFTTISLNREFRYNESIYNDIIVLLHWRIVLSGSTVF